MIRVGTAGWALRKEQATMFTAEGSHLARYAAVFRCVEINSSFYLPHRRGTYERWGREVPDLFRFAVKLPKRITHEKRLADCAADLAAFVDAVTGLGHKLGPLLVQLPPSLQWEESLTRNFFDNLRERHAGAVVCEPRHASWFERAAAAQLRRFRIGRVAADPAPHAAAALPAGFLDVSYFRWHGSPRMYYSAYDAPRLDELACTLRHAEQCAEEVYCIFDNTAENAAMSDAMGVLKRLVTSQRMVQSSALRKLPKEADRDAGVHAPDVRAPA
jgi:uncharacterized protein YecE (DUF72 family)